MFFYSPSSDAPKPSSKTVFSQLLLWFETKSFKLSSWFQWQFWLNCRNIESKDCWYLVQIQTRLCLSICVFADSASVHSGKLHSPDYLITKENDKILLTKCPPHLVYNTAGKVRSAYLERKVWVTFSYLKIRGNKIFSLIEMEGESLPTRYLSLLPVIGKMLKCLPAIKSYFSKHETRGMSFSNLEIRKDENKEGDYRKMEIYILFFQNCLLSVWCPMWIVDENSHEQKTNSLYDNRTASELKNVTRKG